MKEIKNMMSVIIAELETICKYTEYVHQAECPTCKNTFVEIVNEEWKHVGEALGVIKLVRPEVWDLIVEGMGEVKVETEFDKSKPMIGDLIKPGMGIQVHP